MFKRITYVISRKVIEIAFCPRGSNILHVGQTDALNNSCVIVIFIYVCNTIKFFSFQSTDNAIIASLWCNANKNSGVLNVWILHKLKYLIYFFFILLIETIEIVVILFFISSISTAWALLFNNNVYNNYFIMCVVFPTLLVEYKYTFLSNSTSYD